MMILKSVAVEVTETVFKNEFKATMYVTKDNDLFVVGFPCVSFCYEIKGECDLENLGINGIHGVDTQNEEIVKDIREAIEELGGFATNNLYENDIDGYSIIKEG
ncbi:hypothetical protein [Peribacillus asahii]|uniref:hypothetical protein n=1 Tax=Peribacillus asahii TaxID=228899 RepID=UPI0020795092|nr:hypothetical protein [Peribacillus asahii]USK72617.1 hypothetical protein LIS76_23520 [Peribacillus asahii]USK72733.1 hypothetical protein LIS76_23700 [Peribacillus asahii]